MTKGIFVKASNGRIVTPKFRLSFHSLWEQAKYAGKAYWGCNMIFDESETEFGFLLDEFERVAIEKFKTRPGNLKLPLRPGTEYEHEGYGVGVKFMPARNGRQKPVVRDENNSILVEPNSRIYNGCYCVASIGLWAYDYKGEDGIKSKGISATLYQVKKISDGASFGAGDNMGDELGGDEFSAENPPF